MINADKARSLTRDAIVSDDPEFLCLLTYIEERVRASAQTGKFIVSIYNTEMKTVCKNYTNYLETIMEELTRSGYFVYHNVCGGISFSWYWIFRGEDSPLLSNKEEFK